MIRAMASMTSSPREILLAVNRVLLRDLEKGRFVSAFFALLDPKTRTLTMANAGHTPLLICRQVGNTIRDPRRRMQRSCHATRPRRFSARSRCGSTVALRRWLAKPIQVTSDATSSGAAS